ncbi:hypothetical protein [Parapedobacter defluvii]|uniref:hypothetical protein n=1 Tax=Parapedobacter defluvii TaxID=2045106 RepID=UPI00166400D0|nr:hypothetical protein [Parapedobacter defluvii]
MNRPHLLRDIRQMAYGKPPDGVFTGFPHGLSFGLSNKESLHGRLSTQFPAWLMLPDNRLAAGKS